MNLRVSPSSGSVPTLVVDSDESRDAVLLGLRRLEVEDPQKFQEAFPTGFPRVEVGDPSPEDVLVAGPPGLPPPRTAGPRYPTAVPRIGNPAPKQREVEANPEAERKAAEKRERKRLRNLGGNGGN